MPDRPDCRCLVPRTGGSRWPWTSRTGCARTRYAGPDRLFCHICARGKGQAQMIPGWPYSFVAALETGRTSWTAVLDAIRLGPAHDATSVTAAQLREVVGRIVDADHWQPGDPSVLIVADAGYDLARLA
ncbi:MULTISPECIES: transposase [Amycolatopsis]|uniref:transposase n=1 Tax=Amycolatopsis TaxID=1813 RepID=UPI0018E38C31|nr:transposase [Amycolatopsis sp. M39]